MNNGLSGNIAKAFLQSKLTILLMIAFLLIGGYSTLLIPREEEPQIQVPLADIFIGYPGASPKEVETKLAAPLEKIISDVKGVEYVYSTSMQGQALVTVQFYVGEDVERSLVKLYSELMKHMDKMPQGVTLPLIKTRAIDDVPVLSFTLWSATCGDYQLKQISEALTNEIKKVPDVAEVTILGGRSRQVKVLLDKTRMAASHVDFLTIQQQIKAANVQLPAGTLQQMDTAFNIQTGSFLTSAEETGNLVVGTSAQQPVYLKQVATVKEEAATPAQYVLFGYGGADTTVKAGAMPYAAVTIAIAKKKGADAMQLADRLTAKVAGLKKSLLPDEVHITDTRNYGQTASHKVGELLLHLLIAIVVVTLFVTLAMGWRGGLVVFLSVPVTFALTLFAYYFLHYTLNRITLFALVFITGIVVDDSIIIAENMHRHFALRRLPPLQAALYAINEVGNPTILATFTVIAAVLPMAFVSGMMGPYMSPMPIGASIAMLLSLIVALTLTPYLGYIFLRHRHGNDIMPQQAQGIAGGRMYTLYQRLLLPLLNKRRSRWAFMLGIITILAASVTLFYTRTVALKMLPFDNKNEFQVIIDMPEGTTLEKTLAVTKDIAAWLKGQPLVTNYQLYVGTAAPVNFNGLVRHYDLRQGDNVADIQVNLVDKQQRSLQSHDIARQMRQPIQAIAEKYHANVKIVEVPPGPPVLSTIVAEVYGPHYAQQQQIGRQISGLLRSTADVVDVDELTEADQPEYHLEINKDKAMRYGVAPQQVAATVHAALSGMQAGHMYAPLAYNQTPIVLQLAASEKTEVDDVLGLQVMNGQGNPVALKDLVTVTRTTKPRSIYRKNQKEVVYVLADMAGKLESPAYAIAGVADKLNQVTMPAGYTLQEAYTQQPEDTDQYTVKWDGEWQITYEVFRDLGVAFAVVLILIYMLIVGWFQHFTVPLIMLAAIPLSLIGIVLGHWLLHAYFTATSMIGFIALAGVMVRNSILLIDFINIRLREGIPLKEAIIEAGAVRTTPILLTAGAVVLGAVIILFDPIFQGLAISLIGGTLTSTFLTLLVVPLLYFKMMRNSTLKP